MKSDPKRHQDDPERAGSFKIVASITSRHRGFRGGPAVKWTCVLFFSLLNGSRELALTCTTATY